MTSLALGYPATPRTIFTRARQLHPGERWTLAPERRVRRYFVPRERIARGRTLAEAAEAVGHEVTRAVVRAVPAGARVAAFLSGGLDSSVVLARLRQSGVSVEAFTLYFGDEHPGEMRYARAVAQHLGVRHNVLEIDTRRFVDAVEPAVLHLEDIVSEAIAVPNFLLAREAARGHDVIFTGEGGDQSFGGPKNIGDGAGLTRTAATLRLPRCRRPISRSTITCGNDPRARARRRASSARSTQAIGWRTTSPAASSTSAGGAAGLRRAGR